MLAMKQRQVSSPRVGVLGRGHHNGVELGRTIEDASKVGESIGLWVTLRRRIQRHFVHVTKDRDILVGTRPSRGRLGPAAAAAYTAAWHNRELVQARLCAAAHVDDRDCQFYVSNLSP